MTALGGGRSRPRPFRRLRRRSGCVPAWPYPPLSYFQSGSHQPRRAILLQRTATTPLTDCLTVGVHLTQCSPSPLIVRRPPDPRPFLHRPTETLDALAILKGGDCGDRHDLRPARKMTKQTQFRTTSLQSMGCDGFPVRLDGPTQRDLTDRFTGIRGDIKLRPGGTEEQKRATNYRSTEPLERSNGSREMTKQTQFRATSLQSMGYGTHVVYWRPALASAPCKALSLCRPTR